jgi:hypothetical protein
MLGEQPLKLLRESSGAFLLALSEGGSHTLADEFAWPLSSCRCGSADHCPRGRAELHIE